MEESKRHKRGRKVKWTYNACHEEARKYKTVKEFVSANVSCYEVARRHKWLKDYDWLDTPTRRRYEEAERCKKEFKEKFNEFVPSLRQRVSCENGDWNIKGYVDAEGNVHPFPFDTKLISAMLQQQIFPYINEFAKEIGYYIVPASKQNYYPDCTFVKCDNEKIKFAVDIKTTFRRKDDDDVSFTLGSHGTYFSDRDNSKNIQFPYNHYKGHFCVGVVYTYVPDANPCIRDFDFFFAEKWKIASDKQGSGNTANIGSISCLKDIKAESGVFSKLGEEYFDEYWLSYKRKHAEINGKRKPISNIWEFLVSRGEEDKFDLVGNGAGKKPKD